MIDRGEMLLAEVGAALLEAGPGVECSWDRVTISCPQGLKAFLAALEKRCLIEAHE